MYADYYHVAKWYLTLNRDAVRVAGVRLVARELVARELVRRFPTNP